MQQNLPKGWKFPDQRRKVYVAKEKTSLEKSTAEVRKKETKALWMENTKEIKKLKKNQNQSK